MLDWFKKTATCILILPVLLLVLHDVIPHHHHAVGIHGVVCSHQEPSDCEDGDHHNKQLCESHQPCDIENCEACHFTDEFVIDNTYRKSLSILPPQTVYSFQLFYTIRITPCLQAFIPDNVCFLTFYKRGPPSNLS